jgi:hypothetical protein
MTISGSGIANWRTQSQRPSPRKSSISRAASSTMNGSSSLIRFGRNAWLNSGPHLAVLWVVAARQRRSRHPPALLVQLADHLRARVDAAAVAGAGEPLGVEQHLAHVVVPRDHPHPGARIVPGGRLRPQRVVRGVRAVGDVGIEEVDLLERERLLVGAIVRHTEHCRAPVAVDRSRSRAGR